MAKTITDPSEAAQELKSHVERAKSVVFFGGAGVSTASGIPDFRSPNGLYHQRGYKYPPETMLSHSFYESHMEEFYDFYRHVMCAPDVRPNQAHRKLAELEAEGRLTAVITQNIDGLHQAAGSKNVIELHGSTHRNICRRCGEVYSQEWILATDGIPHCEKCGGVVKPDVVLYEEALDQGNISRAVRAIERCDMLIIGGTSLVVYPAAGLVQYFRGNDLVICSLEPTPQDGMADLVCACDIARAFEF
jgi:NAD-dependent deacetylase